MSLTTDFIVELIRAANEIDKLTASEKNRLLDRAAAIIRDMRGQVGIPATRTRADAVVELQVVAASVPFGRRTNEQVKAVLLNAAAMIRDLHIVLDTKTVIQIGEHIGS
uniref:hypothetical protein n=1 Tax=Neorhizobium sp. EC2-8 TaxID=3129230 RepID=UPI0031019506